MITNGKSLQTPKILMQRFVVNAAGAWCDLIAENIGTKK